MDRIKVGLIGYGYWGPNLARTLYDMPAAELAAIVDQKKTQLERARRRHPGVALTTDYRELSKMGVDAVAISTPPKSHFSIAKDCLLQGLHVLVEKPITLTSADAEELIDLADSKRLTLMVGHTFEYNSAVQAMKRLIDSGELGQIYYLDSARLNLGLFQRDLNVLWDLAPHDISIFLYLLGDRPIYVTAQGITCVTPGVYDVAYLSLIFPHNVAAFAQVNWLYPRKVRRTTVVGSKKMATFSDLDDEGKLRIYDKAIDAPSDANSFGEFEFNYRAGDITVPYIRFTEPLMEECKHFIECVANHREPRSSGRSGLQVVKVLEAAQRSISKSSTHELIRW